MVTSASNTFASSSSPQQTTGTSSTLNTLPPTFAVTMSVQIGTNVSTGLTDLVSQRASSTQHFQSSQFQDPFYMTGTYNYFRDQRSSVTNINSVIQPLVSSTQQAKVPQTDSFQGMNYSMLTTSMQSRSPLLVPPFSSSSGVNVSPSQCHNNLS